MERIEVMAELRENVLRPCQGVSFRATPAGIRGLFPSRVAKHDSVRSIGPLLIFRERDEINEPETHPSHDRGDVGGVNASRIDVAHVVDQTGFEVQQQPFFIARHDFILSFRVK